MKKRKYKGSKTVYPKQKGTSGLPILGAALRKLKKISRNARISKMSRRRK